MKISKMLGILVVAITALSVCNLKADEAKSAVSATNEVPAYYYNFENVPTSKVLDLYAQLAGVELKNEKQIPSFGGINFKASKLTRSEAIQSLEKVLREQGGVVFKPVDTKHVEVSYDESVKSKN